MSAAVVAAAAAAASIAASLDADKALAASTAAAAVAAATAGAAGAFGPAPPSAASVSAGGAEPGAGDSAGRYSAWARKMMARGKGKQWGADVRVRHARRDLGVALRNALYARHYGSREDDGPEPETVNPGPPPVPYRGPKRAACS